MTVAVLVQPALVTLIVYIPVVFTVGVVVVPPPVTPGPAHTIDPPLEVPAKTVDVFEQVNDCVGPAVTVGLGLTVMLTASVEVQPDEVVVTV